MWQFLFAANRAIPILLWPVKSGVLLILKCKQAYVNIESPAEKGMNFVRFSDNRTGPENRQVMFDNDKGFILHAPPSPSITNLKINHTLCAY